MAGKDTGAYDNGGTAVAGFEWSPRTARAYAEGREGNPATDPHGGNGSAASVAWIAGDARKAVGADQHETAVV